MKGSKRSRTAQIGQVSGRFSERQRGSEKKSEIISPFECVCPFVCVSMRVHVCVRVCVCLCVRVFVCLCMDLYALRFAVAAAIGDCGSDSRSRLSFWVSP